MVERGPRRHPVGTTTALPGLKSQAKPLGIFGQKEENGERERSAGACRVQDDGKELADAIDGFYRGGRAAGSETATVRWRVVAESPPGPALIEADEVPCPRRPALGARWTDVDPSHAIVE
jgi:hypothetical protein